MQSSGLIEHYKKEKGERGEARVENLLELVSAARGFSPRARRTCRRSSRSWRMPCSSPARARRMPRRTACR